MEAIKPGVSSGKVEIISWQISRTPPQVAGPLMNIPFTDASEYISYVVTAILSTIE